MEVTRRGVGGATARFEDLVILFCDVEGSTRRWDADPEAMNALMEHHHRVVDEVITEAGGRLVGWTGDGALARFDGARAAIDAAIGLQRRLPDGPAEAGVDAAALRSRVGIHRGRVEERNGELFGPSMHRTARIMSTAAGGQIVVSGLIADELTADEHTAHESSADGLGSFSLEPLGVHRLKGFADPETLVQVCADGLPHEFPPLRSENRSAGWLPSIPEQIIGRDGEVARTVAALEPGRVVTLVGPGGVGKTRLGVHSARAATHRFPDGSWFVDLLVVSDPARLARVVADGLRLGSSADRDPIEALRQTLSGSAMLLVLDNCEHVLDATRDLLRQILGDTAASAVLCTSQRAVGVVAEHVVSLDPFDVEADAGHSAAVELFARRARAVQPDFAVAPTDLDQIVEICRRLEGLPLAIELAASRVRTMSVETIAARLGDRFAFLRSRDHPERHRTLLAAIEWSVGLLADTEREVLVPLGVFAGSFGVLDVVAVSGLDEFDVLDGLDELVQRSLVVADGERFRLLDSVRGWSRQAMAQAGVLDETLAAHARHLASLVPDPFDHHDPEVVGERLDAASGLAADLDAALEWFVEHDLAAGARLAVLLADPWAARGRPVEGVGWLERFDRDELDAERRIDLLGWRSGFDWIIGDNDRSEALARAAIELAAAEGLPYPGFAAARLAVRLAFTGRVEEAVEVAEAAEVALDDDEARARQLGVLAVVHAVAGDTGRGIVLADLGVENARRCGALRTATALANRMIVTPGHPSVVAIAEQVADLAERMRRRPAGAQATLALAVHRRSEGDLDGFLRGVVEFGEVMLEDRQLTSALNGLELVPAELVEVDPYAALVLAEAVRSAGDRLGQSGTPFQLEAREGVERAAEERLSPEDRESARAEGSAMDLDQAVDFLRWVAEGERTIVLP